MAADALPPNSARPSVYTENGQIATVIADVLFQVMPSHQQAQCGLAKLALPWMLQIPWHLALPSHLRR